MAKLKIVFNKEISALGVLLSVIILGTIIGLGIHLVFAWTGPSTNPPPDPASINVSPPITETGGQTIGGDLTLSGDLTVNGVVSGALTITGNINGQNSKNIVNYPSNIFNGGIGTTPYMRVNAESFHTYGTGNGQMYIEGYAIDASNVIRIGTGLAGGQIARSVIMGDNLTVNNSLTVLGSSTLRGSILNDSGDLTLNDNVIIQNGYLRLANYATKPSCGAGNLGAMVFDTADDKPYVCVSTGWKDLDRDPIAYWKQSNASAIPPDTCSSTCDPDRPILDDAGKCFTKKNSNDCEWTAGYFGDCVDQMYSPGSGTGNLWVLCAR